MRRHVYDGVFLGRMLRYLLLRQIFPAFYPPAYRYPSFLTKGSEVVGDGKPVFDTAFFLIFIYSPILGSVLGWG
jgi:hypothetical protein